jgi:hypothetical protein
MEGYCEKRIFGIEHEKCNIDIGLARRKAEIE